MRSPTLVPLSGGQRIADTSVFAEGCCGRTDLYTVDVSQILLYYVTYDKPSIDLFGTPVTRYNSPYALCKIQFILHVLVQQQCYLYGAEFQKPFSLSSRWVSSASGTSAFERTEQSEELWHIIVLAVNSRVLLVWVEQTLRGWNSSWLGLVKDLRWV